MKKNLGITVLFFLGAAAVAGFGLLSSCAVDPGSTAAGTGSLNIMMTDAPSDDWQEVSVLMKAVSVYENTTHAWKEVWTADPANAQSGKVNLVDLSGVAMVLKQARVSAGTYSRIKFTMNSNSSTMKLVNDSGTQIDPSAIKMVGDGKNGEITVDLDPAVKVNGLGAANIQVDFDLSHPVSLLNIGGMTCVNFQARCKPMPHKLSDLQFARNIGAITAAASDNLSFTLETLQASELTFQVNDSTIYMDADANAAGTFAGLAALAGTGAAMVASNMNSDGTLYARRVWYAASVDTLPRFSPEGLVRRVGDNWIRILKEETREEGDHHFCHWDSDTIMVDGATVWTFRGDVPMGTGLSVLQYIRKGCRVEVTFVDENASPRVAATINVLSAYEEGTITAVGEADFNFGWWNHKAHTLSFSTVTDHVFSWWYYGDPSAGSTSVVDFANTVNQALSAHLWAFAWAELYWDAANVRWVAENLVLAPEKLSDSAKITTDYAAETGSMGVTTYCWWDEAQSQVMTIYLDTSGNLQTVVASCVFNWTNGAFTFTFPVLPADWPALLTTSLQKVRIWVRPVKGTDEVYNWHAYTVMAYQDVH